MMTSLLIRTRLVLMVALAFSAILAVGVVGYLGNSRLSNELENSTGDFAALNNHLLADMMHDAIRADVLEAIVLSETGNIPSIADSIKELEEHSKIFFESLEKNTRAISLTEKTRKAIEGVRPALNNYSKLGDEIAKLAVTNLAAAHARYPEFDKAFKILETENSHVSDMIAAEVAESRASGIEAEVNGRNLALAVGVVAVLILLLAGYTITASITKPLQHFQQTIDRVGRGDYAARVRMTSADEVSTVGRAFDTLLDERVATLAKAEANNEQLNQSVVGLLGTMFSLSQRDLTVRAAVTDDIVGTLGDSVNQLTDATSTVLRDVTNIAGVVGDASRRVKEQSDTVTGQSVQERGIVVKLVSNLKAATDAMQQVAQLAGNSSLAAAEASRSTENALASVQNSVRGMDAIRETISEMEKRIKRLGERSQEISKIVGLINTISERTHVLSLNASMQAAMAGDAGRGFAVVAEEVQRLADNSRQATEQIANLVQNIQVDTNDTIATVNKTIDQVVQGSDMARSSGEKMRETREATERLVQLVQTIASSTGEQMRLAGELGDGAVAITASIEKTDTQLQQQNQATDSLLSAAQKLVESVSVFKLPATAG